MEAANSDYCGWKGWAEETFGLVDPVDSVYFAEQFRAAGFERMLGLNVFEIGFGNGSFAAWATESGANYLGTEAIAALVAKGVSAGFNVFDAAVPLRAVAERGSLDLIVAFDVFEHLEAVQIKEVLESARHLLKSGGRVVARVPSGDSPFGRAIQHGDLTHRTVLGSSAIRQLARETVFDVVFIRQPAFPLRGLGPRTYLRRLLVAATRSMIYPIIARVLMGHGQPVLTPNLIFVLAKP
jgi:SAM-dependent methyltransferase